MKSTEHDSNSTRHHTAARRRIHPRGWRGAWRSAAYRITCAHRRNHSSRVANGSSDKTRSGVAPRRPLSALHKYYNCCSLEYNKNVVIVEIADMASSYQK